MLLTPNPTNSCFGCGAANPRGMLLTFEQDDATRRIRGAFRLGAEYQGGGGFIHGGIIALVLDEAMGKVNRFRGVRAVTAELTIEYIRPIPVDEDLVIEAHEVDKDGRNLHYVGEIANRAGKLLARGKGRFVEIDPDKFKIERAEVSAPGNQPRSCATVGHAMPCPAKELGNKAVDFGKVFVAPVFRPAGSKGLVDEF